MDGFWNFVSDDLAPVVGYVIGGLILLMIVLWLLSGLGVLGKLFTVDTYRALRYERHGICGICKQPYTAYRAKTADQAYGPDQVTQGVCPNGHVSILRGNRRFADWADF